MDGTLVRERVRAHYDRQPCDSELSARERLSRAKLERHRQIYRERGFGSEEGLSRNTDGPDHPWCRVYDAREARELLTGFVILRHEIRFFDHRHWGLLGRLMPGILRRWLGRHWGWHRIVHARKPAPRLAEAARGGARA